MVEYTIRFTKYAKDRDAIDADVDHKADQTIE